MECWHPSQATYGCRLTGVNGDLVYKGEFVPYYERVQEDARTISIDPVRSRNHRLWVGQELVPLVYLDDGQVLIPAAKVEEGISILQGKGEDSMQ